MHDVAWRGMWICVRSKDAQKQLARTSLRAPMAEDIFFLISSICFAHERCSSINRPSDLASLTFLIVFPIHLNTFAFPYPLDSLCVFPSIRFPLCFPIHSIPFVFPHPFDYHCVSASIRLPLCFPIHSTLFVYPYPFGSPCDFPTIRFPLCLPINSIPFAISHLLDPFEFTIHLIPFVIPHPLDFFVLSHPFDSLCIFPSI